jgi:23S rRNA pseudouridine955/2504/2580 synthase
MFLHACRLAVVHPISGERLTFEAPLPAELRMFLEDKTKADAQAV